MKMRRSNFELMRIVSMFMIIVWHLFLYGVNMDTASPSLKLVFDFFRSIMVVHVNSFILLSGYFLVNSEFKMSKLLKLNDTVVFYKIIIYLIFVYFGFAATDSITILRNFFPLDLENYWFIRIYMLMYIFSPFYNILINKISKNVHKNLLLVMFLVFSFISTFTNQEAVVDNTVYYGYSIVSFTFLYFIGAYLRKYPIDMTYFGKKYSKNFKQFIFILLFIVLALLNYCMHITSIQFMNHDGLFKYIGNIIFISFNQYDNPIVLFQAICYFMIFYYMNFSSKAINYVSKAVFGIYLIHENLYLRTNMYKWFNFPNLVNSKTVFVHIFVSALVIFVSCFIIESFRQFIFKKVSNFKISKWWREKYRGYLKSLGLNIKW